MQGSLAAQGMPSNNVQDAWDPQLPEDSHDGDLTDSHEPLSSRILRSSFASIIAALPQVPGYENTDTAPRLDQSRSGCEVARSAGSFPIAKFHRPRTNPSSRPSDVAAKALTTPFQGPQPPEGGNASGAVTDRSSTAHVKGSAQQQHISGTGVLSRSMSAPPAVFAATVPPAATSPRAHRVSTEEYTSSMEDADQPTHGRHASSRNDGEGGRDMAGPLPGIQTSHAHTALPQADIDSKQHNATGRSLVTPRNSTSSLPRNSTSGLLQRKEVWSPLPVTTYCFA